MITPTLIFLMLFVTFCRVTPKQMHLSMLHLWLLLFQVVASVAVYLLLEPLNGIVAQGAMICVLAPIAMAAVVIGGMLGANVATMTTYSLLCNMVIALVAPVVIALTGSGHCSFVEILSRVAPLLIMPFAAAQCCRFPLPPRLAVDCRPQPDFLLHVAAVACRHHRTHDGLHHRPARCLAGHRALAGLRGAGHLSGAVQNRPHAGPPLRRCGGGRPVARPEEYGAGVWMAQSFLNPISSIAPTAYIVWQNFVNSYQIYRRDRERRRQQA